MVSDGGERRFRIWDPSQDKWDRRFLEMAKLVASWSKDPSTQTGAVIVAPDRRIVSLGYNGFPRGVSDSPNRLKDREWKYEHVVHCEMNAVLFADRHLLKGSCLYTWPFASCVRCAVHMIQVGIVRAVSPTLPADKAKRWGESLNKTREVFAEAGVEFVEFRT